MKSRSKLCISCKKVTLRMQQPCDEALHTRQQTSQAAAEGLKGCGWQSLPEEAASFDTMRCMAGSSQRLQVYIKVMAVVVDGPWENYLRLHALCTMFVCCCLSCSYIWQKVQCIPAGVSTRKAAAVSTAGCATRTFSTSSRSICTPAWQTPTLRHRLTEMQMEQVILK